jgi:hypothetical protein
VEEARARGGTALDAQALDQLRQRDTRSPPSASTTTGCGTGTRGTTPAARSAPGCATPSSRSSCSPVTSTWTGRTTSPERGAKAAKRHQAVSGYWHTLIGAILGAAIVLARALTEPWQYAVLAGAAVLLLGLRRGVVLTLLTVGAVGLFIALVGGPLPHWPTVTSGRYNWLARILRPAADAPRSRWVPVARTSGPVSPQCRSGSDRGGQWRIRRSQRFAEIAVTATGQWLTSSGQFARVT